MRRLWRESKGVRWMVLACSLLGCAGVGFSLLFVWTTKAIVDAATSPAGEIPGRLVGLLIGCLVLQLLLPALSGHLDAKALTTLSIRMRSRIYSRLMHSEWQGRGAYHTGDVINRLYSDVSSLATLICSTIPGLLSVLLQLVGAFLFLAFMSYKLALIVVFIMPLALVISKVYIRTTRKLTKDIRDEDSKIQTFLQEHLGHRTLIATLQATGRSASSYLGLQQTITAKIMRKVDISLFSRGAVTFGFMAGYVAAFLWSADGLINGTVTFGMMTAFLQLVSQVQRPVVDIAGRVPAFVNGSVAAERIDAMTSLPQEASGNVTLPREPLGLRLDDVTYRYPDGDEDVMSGLSFDFKPGNMTGIAGETGAGKSTLLRMVLGLIRPTKGRVVMYGSDGKTVEVSPQTRKGIVYVPQGNSLMTATVRENLQLGNPDATDEEMKKALHDAAADFVAELPEGLDTMCSEGGGGFSEGQAQRIAIARGLLMHGGIVLLDEPTSALDPATEEVLLDRLSRRLKDRTVIIVTHRPATLERCSAVLRLG